MVVESGPEVETLNAVRRPRPALVRRLEAHYLDAWRCDRCAREGIFAVEGLPGGDMGGEGGASKEIEGELSLLEELVEEVNREVRVLLTVFTFSQLLW